MTAFLIVHSTLTDPARFKSYVEASEGTLKLYQGEYLLGGQLDTVLEGDHKRDRTVIFKFPSTKQAKSWYSSKEYGEVKSLRDGTGDFDFVLIESFD